MKSGSVHGSFVSDSVTPWTVARQAPLSVGLSRQVDSAAPWTVARQAPLSVGLSRQEHWSGLPFPSPGDLPDPGIKPGSPALQADSLLSRPPGKPPRICEAFRKQEEKDSLLYSAGGRTQHLAIARDGRGHVSTHRLLPAGCRHGFANQQGFNKKNVLRKKTTTDFKMFKKLEQPLDKSHPGNAS